MTSFNHYAFGAVVDWMHRVIGGLAPAAPGYRQLHIEPRPGGGITWARTSHVTPYGLAEVSWRREHRTMTVDVTVPAGSTARRADERRPCASRSPGGTSSAPAETPPRSRVNGPCDLRVEHRTEALGQLARPAGRGGPTGRRDPGFDSAFLAYRSRAGTTRPDS